MNKQAYFSSLQKGLPSDAYKDRFLQELEEHLEDSLYRKSIHRHMSEESVLQGLGRPEDIIFNYKKLMKKRSPLAPYLEALFRGILILPFSLIFFVGNTFTEASELFLNKLSILLLVTAGIGFLSYVFYRIIFSQVAPLNQVLDKRGKILSFVLTLLPTCLSTFSFTLTFFFGDVDERQDYFFPLVIGLFLAVYILASWRAFLHSFTKTPWRSSSLTLNMFVLLALIVLLFWTDIGSAVVYFTRVIWFVAFAGHLQLAVWGSGLLLILLGGISVYSLVRWHQNRREYFPFFKGIFFLFILFALLVPHSAATRDSQLSFSKPALEVASVLDREIFGPFYHWSVLFRSKGGPQIWYSIQSDDSSFLVRLHELGDYRLEPDSAGAFTWEALGFVSDQPFLQGTLDVPFRCELSKEAALAHGDSTEALILGGETDCDRLYYNEELIFEKESSSPLFLKNLALSSDQQWLLLQLVSMNDDPEALYLVELK